MRIRFGQFEDPALEAAFRQESAARMYWVITAPWLAGSLVVLASITLAYLRLGLSTDFVLVAVARTTLVAAILVWAWRVRTQMGGSLYYAAAIALLLGLLVFNITAVAYGATDWVRITRTTIIEMFLITLSLMLLSRDAWWALGTIWAAHFVMGAISFTIDPVQVFNEMLVVSLAAIVGGVLSWRYSISEREAYLNRLELNQARHEAEQAALAKASFLANMSHEIRTPMTGILGMLDITLDRNLNKEERDDIEEVRSCATNLLSILNDILDYSKIESEGLTLSPEVVEAAPMIKQVEALFRAKALGKNIEISTQLHDLPDYVYLDATRFCQVLSNLVGNAIKFTERGYVQIQAAWVDVDQVSGQLRMAVKDTGIGISKQACDSLFQRFAQAEADTAKRFGGTGLGLSISKEIIAAMQGNIGVDSIEGKGSTFWFDVPCAKATAEQAVEQKHKAVLPELASMKLLVADDNPVNRKIVAAYLKKAGHEATLVEDGEAALKAVESQQFDAVLMDVNMPKLDGIEATQAIRKLAEPLASTPIIALTANTMEGDREALLAAGMDDYVAKPIEQAQLFNALANCGTPSVASPSDTNDR